MESERRFTSFRAEGNIVEGIAVPYGVPSQIGRFTETISPGAFGEIGAIRANLMHDRTRPIAVNKAGGGLVLEDRADALHARLELPEHGEGPGVLELIERGVIQGWSAEMAVRRDRWEGRSRTVESAYLVGLSLVDQPGHKTALATLEKRWQSCTVTVLRPVPLWVMS